MYNFSGCFLKVIIASSYAAWGSTKGSNSNLLNCHQPRLHHAGSAVSTECFLVRWFLVAFPGMLSFAAVVIDNLVIAYVKRWLSQKTRSRSNDLRSARHEARIREVATQGFYYVKIFLICVTISFLIRVLDCTNKLESERDAFFLFVVDAMLLIRVLDCTNKLESERGAFFLFVVDAMLPPLQRLLNLLVYSRPNYTRFHANHPDALFYHSLFKVWLDPNIPKLQLPGNKDGKVADIDSRARSADPDQ
jgi:hypothetical protein